MPSEEQIQVWRQLWLEMQSSPSFVTYRLERNTNRLKVRQEMLGLLDSYLNKKIDNAEFRAIFQQKTANEWDTFGLSGFSGAMFLNMLVNNIPDQDSVAIELRKALPIPEDEHEGYQRLYNFMYFLSELSQSGKVSRHRVPLKHSLKTHPISNVLVATSGL